MPDTKTYTGGCHCGLVRFECTTDLAMVTACNCSICTKKGLHFAFLAPKSFQLRAGEDNLREYVFNRHAIRHQLCNDCGVDVFARGSKPDGADRWKRSVTVIPGCATWRRPGIHTPCRGYGFRARSFLAPRNDEGVR